MTDPDGSTFFSAFSALLRRIFKRRGGEVTEEEILEMIDEGNQKDMIHNIFEFDDRDAVDIMTHRTEITALEVSASLEEVIAVAVESSYSRIPVYEESLDNIVGILYAKDLLSLVTQNPGNFELRDRMREPMFVLESVSCKRLLDDFRAKKIQMAVVVDEYGGTAGIVTMEDLLESIVGSIQDEYDDEEDEISRIAGNLYHIAGTATLEDAAREIDFECGDDADDFETIGGYLIHLIGRIPGEGEHPRVAVGDIVFTVLEMDDRRVKRIEARRIVP
jgi:putative hemolysin